MQQIYQTNKSICTICGVIEWTRRGLQKPIQYLVNSFFLYGFDKCIILGFFVGFLCVCIIYHIYIHQTDENMYPCIYIYSCHKNIDILYNFNL
jgi:hypothetical protein